MRECRKQLRDFWHKATNISPSHVNQRKICSFFHHDVQQHLTMCLNRPLQERINYRAGLWTTTYRARNFGYGAGSRAKRRAYLLWQGGKITAEQLDAAGAKPLHFPQVSPFSWQLQ